MTMKYSRGENFHINTDSAQGEKSLEALKRLVLKKRGDEYHSREGYRGSELPDFEKAKEFLRVIENVYSVPEVSFHDLSSIFVCIPIYDEDESTIQRLFSAWDASRISEGVTGEVIFFVNNRTDSPTHAKERNKQIVALLQNLSQNSDNTALQYHVIDASSPTKELPPDMAIGMIRNCSVAPVIRHILETKRNAVILSSDADTFPTHNVLSELYSAFQKKGSFYGIVPLRFEYDTAFSQEEVKEIERILLCMDIHATLFSFLTRGELQYEPIHGGSHTFYSCDRFLSVGGYRNSLATGEDTQLSQDFEKTFSDQSTLLHNALMINTIRYSHRLEGDGTMFAIMRDRKWRVHFHAHNLMYRAYLENWYQNNRG